MNKRRHSISQKKDLIPRKKAHRFGKLTCAKKKVAKKKKRISDILTPPP